MALSAHYVASDMVAVDTWPDRSGGGRDLTQASAAARPVKTAAITPNGTPAVFFDGTNDNMASTAFASPSAGVSVVALIRPTHTADSFRTLLCHAAGATWATPFARALLRTSSAANIGWEGYAESAATSANGAQEGATLSSVAQEGSQAWFILEMVYDQTNIKLYRDGVETATKALTGAMTPTTQPLFIGARTGPGDYYQGYIAELRYYDAALDSTARNAARTAIIASHMPVGYDSLQGAANAVLAGRVAPLTGQTWAKLSGGTIILDDSGSYARQSVGGYTMYTFGANQPSADYEVQSTFRMPGAAFGDTFAVTARVQDASNYYAFRSNSGVWKINKLLAGGETVVGNTYSAALADNDVAKLVINGTTLTGYVNGVVRCTGTDASISAPGKAGVWWNAVNDNTGVGFDDYTVRLINPPSVAGNFMLMRAG